VLGNSAQGKISKFHITTLKSELYNMTGKPAKKVTSKFTSTRFKTNAETCFGIFIIGIDAIAW